MSLLVCAQVRNLAYNMQGYDGDDKDLFGNNATRELRVDSVASLAVPVLAPQQSLLTSTPQLHLQGQTLPARVNHAAAPTTVVHSPPCLDLCSHPHSTGPHQHQSRYAAGFTPTCQTKFAQFPPSPSDNSLHHAITRVAPRCPNTPLPQAASTLVCTCTLW